MKLTLSFATRYNGVYLNPTDEDVNVTEEMEEVLEKVSNTLPSMTYDMVEKFDHYLTKEQIETLIEKAKEIIKPVIPIADITFEYDHYSS